jgi:hypothetical protein
MGSIETQRAAEAKAVAGMGCRRAFALASRTAYSTPQLYLWRARRYASANNLLMLRYVHMPGIQRERATTKAMVSTPRLHNPYAFLILQS